MSLVPPKPAASLTPGRKLDRYELLCPIAEGGMGVCWLARLQGKHGFEKLVAVKTMKSEYATDPEFERMFLDEARIASGIEHQNVAQILELGEHEDVLYLAMEYVEGDSLFKLRREVVNKGEEVPVGIVLRILADTLGGLHAAHELTDAQGVSLGVVHRDVSPQNILVSTRGSAKLIDFGIAKARDRSAGETSTGTIKGKLHFMAPEQALGKKLDRRADVFSVGAILYFLLSGKYAYHGETQAATVLKLAEGRPPLPLPKTIPAAVSAIVLRALSYDPSKRFATAAEMQAAIERAMSEAGLATTVADVAAFVDKHMGHRAETRRQVIDQAIAALTRGARVKSDPLITNTGSISGVDQAQAAALVEGARALAASRAAFQTDPGSPTLGASSMMLTPSPGRAKVPMAVIGAVLGALFLTGVILSVIALGRVGGATAPTAASTPSGSTSAAAVPAPPTETGSVEAAAASAEPPPAVPDASAAPVAASATPAAGPGATAPAKAHASPTKLPVATPSATTTAKKRRRVDDGF